MSYEYIQEFMLMANVVRFSFHQAQVALIEPLLDLHVPACPCMADRVASNNLFEILAFLQHGIAEATPIGVMSFISFRHGSRSPFLDGPSDEKRIV